MEIVVITGMSGAGKSAAVKVFEDLGFNCVDNMPPILIPKFIEICSTASAKFKRLALVIDTRTGELFNDLFSQIDSIKNSEVKVKLVYLEASDEILINRYKETRRRHPLIDSARGSLIDAVKKERSILNSIREMSDYVIDTSHLSSKNLRDQLIDKFSQQENALQITVLSFGQKYGPQSDVDMQFDVRCLPNPYYIDELRNRSALDDDVYEYVFSFNSAKEYYKRVKEMIISLLPQFANEGKTNLNIAFCCTGGKHRSVSFAKKLGADLAKNNFSVSVVHRDVDKLKG